MVEAKAVSEHERGNIGMLRAYLMLSGTFLMGLPKFMEMPEDVSATEQVKHLMKWRDDATEKKWMEKTGVSPLHVACGLGHTDAVREMLKDKEMMAFLNKKMGVINKMDADYGKDRAKAMGTATIVETINHATPLAVAMLCGTPEMIKDLMAAGANPGSFEFGIGCQMGPLENMKAFVEMAGAKFDITAKGGMDMMCNTPLHNVAMFGDSMNQFEKISYLLENGASKSIGMRNMMGFTPLSGLCMNMDSNPKCVKLLIDHGAKIDERDKPGLLFRAVRGLMATMAKTKKYRNMQMMVDMFGYGRQPLHHASKNANVNMLRALHAAGAPIDAMDGKKQSAHDLCVKAMPDSHAPELLSDVLLPKDQLKKSVNVVKAVGKMQALTRSSKVHPAGGEAKAANKYAVAVTAE